MTKEQLFENCRVLVGDEIDERKLELLINSALAFVNGYTFQEYSLSSISAIPFDVLSVIMDLVADKYQGKGNVISEKISDYAVSYDARDLTDDMRKQLNRYVIYTIC